MTRSIPARTHDRILDGDICTATVHVCLRVHFTVESMKYEPCSMLHLQWALVPSALSRRRDVEYSIFKKFGCLIGLWRKASGSRVMQPSTAKGSASNSQASRTLATCLVSVASHFRMRCSLTQAAAPGVVEMSHAWVSEAYLQESFLACTI